MSSLPTFRSIRRNRRHDGNILTEKPPISNNGDAMLGDTTTSTSSPEPAYNYIPDTKQHRRERRRKIATIISSLLFFFASIFLVMVEIGQTSDKPALRNMYFIQINLSNIFPVSVPNSVLINSIARSLGLHDFYNVGLWNFCEGYNDSGITSCSTPKTLFYFNPVSVLISELLAGATITLPAEITTILHLLKLASNLMFAFFLTGTLLSFINVFLVLVPIISPIAPFSPPPPSTSASNHNHNNNIPKSSHSHTTLYKKILTLLISTFSFLAALLTTAATVIATVMFNIFRNVLTSQDDLNIGAELGVSMFGLMWAAAFCTLVAWGVQVAIVCAEGCCSCCGGRGRRRERRRGGGDVNGNGNGKTEGQSVSSGGGGGSAGRSSWVRRRFGEKR